MKRGLLVLAWVLAVDAYFAFCVNPLGAIGLLLSLAVSPLLLLLLVFGGRNAQNRMIWYALRQSRTTPFVRRRLMGLITVADIADRHPHPVICWSCHHENGCKGPGPGETLDHGCHRGTCPYEKAS